MVQPVIWTCQSLRARVASHWRHQGDQGGGEGQESRESCWGGLEVHWEDVWGQCWLGVRSWAEERTDWESERTGGLKVERMEDWSLLCQSSHSSKYDQRCYWGGERWGTEDEEERWSPQHLSGHGSWWWWHLSQWSVILYCDHKYLTWETMNHTIHRLIN